MLPTHSKSAYCVVNDTKITIPLKDLIDINQEITRQKKKIDKLESELKSVLARLNNQKFISSAPNDVVEKTKGRKKELEDEIKIIQETIKRLN